MSPVSVPSGCESHHRESHTTLDQATTAVRPFRCASTSTVATAGMVGTANFPMRPPAAWMILEPGESGGETRARAHLDAVSDLDRLGVVISRRRETDGRAGQSARLHAACQMPMELSESLQRMSRYHPTGGHHHHCSSSSSSRHSSSRSSSRSSRAADLTLTARNHAQQISSSNAS